MNLIVFVFLARISLEIEKDKSIGSLLDALVEFALSMMDSLQDVNTHSFNNFKMRIGISSGPLVGGVIGAKKPVYDIWGNTVNEASRMDSTGSLDRIQVPKNTAEILKKEGYHMSYRGLVQVKGKGQMETYWVMGKMRRESSLNRSHYNGKKSMTEVISGMVGVRRKQALSSSLSVPSAKQTLVKSPSKRVGQTSTKSSILGDDENRSISESNQDHPTSEMDENNEASILDLSKTLGAVSIFSEENIKSNNNNLDSDRRDNINGDGFKKRSKLMSSSFRIRKSPTPQNFHRMMSEISRVGRSKSFYHKIAKSSSHQTGEEF